MIAPEFTPIASFGHVPDGFLWGVATAAHQIEGGNTNNDWWRFEHAPGSSVAEPSGVACDSWNRWREDLDLIQDMGLNAYRFSLEWSRIEPSEGVFDDAALGRYRDMLLGCREREIKACVTFHHFTLPLWLADKGGVDCEDFAPLFARYCGVAVGRLGDLIDVACTLNEPSVVGMMGYLLGGWPPGVAGDLAAYARATDNLVAAHRAGADALRAGPGDFPIGLALAIPDVVFHPDGTWDGPGYRVDELPPLEGPLNAIKRLMFDAWIEAARGDDFVGVQTYSEVHMGPDGQNLPIPEGVRMTQMSWTYTPEALGRAVRLAASATGVPVIVTENGLATEDDAERVEYISRALAALRAAMDDGVDVRGYFYWSLLDNFEWAEGYRPKFGLATCDRETLDRAPKPAATYYAGIVASSR